MAPANWYYDSDTDDFVCDDCDFSFYHKSQLVRHLSDDHWYCSCEYERLELLSLKVTDPALLRAGSLRSNLSQHGSPSTALGERERPQRPILHPMR